MENEPGPEAGAKIIYLIRRKPATSREEVIMHWFANHMPTVIRSQHAAASKGRRHANKYVATLFNPDHRGEFPWDGMAQLWWDAPLPMPKVPHGTTPTDTFQEKSETYVPWNTVETVVMDGNLPAQPLTLNDPFPFTRSGFCKKSFLVKAKQGVDFESFFAHWLNVHVPNVRTTMIAAGGFRYCVSLSISPDKESYAGLAELYVPNESGWAAYKELIKPDGMEEWVDGQGTLVLTSGTEMVGLLPEPTA
jgi:hypothetical protein